MLNTRFASLFLVGIACLSMGPNARAQDNTNNNEQPGSLLVFPLFDNTRGAANLITVTNTSSTTAIFAHFIYVNAANCLEFDRSRYLSPLDTITVRTSIDNPNMVKGYVYVFARKANSPTSEGPNAVKFDHLIGQEWVFDGSGPDLFELNAFTFKAGTAVANELDNTDVSPANGKRDLNGLEYKTAPDVLEFPRFFGQFPGTINSDLVLLNLTGGGQFQAQADLLVYDNNETQYSSSLTFTCWIRVHLGSPDLSVFDNSILHPGTSGPDNSAETAGTAGVVCGWFTVDGVVAFSTQTQLNNPALLGVLLDVAAPVLPFRTSALPYGEGSNPNGRLLSHSLMGD